MDDAAIDDRRLDLYSLEIPHWWHLSTVLPALKLGHQSENLGSYRWQGKRIEVLTRSKKRINTDGEVTSRTPAGFELCPAALEVFVTPPAEAEAAC